MRVHEIIPRGGARQRMEIFSESIIARRAIKFWDAECAPGLLLLVLRRIRMKVYLKSPAVRLPDGRACTHRRAVIARASLYEQEGRKSEQRQ